MAATDDLIRSLERLQSGDLKWVTVPGRDDPAVVIDDLQVLVGSFRQLKVLFPETGEVALYAQVAVTYR